MGMHYRVDSTVQLDPTEHRETLRYAMPSGFPYLIGESPRSIEIIEPVAGYLFASYAPVSRLLANFKIPLVPKFTSNSAFAKAYDLKDWWEFLDHFNLDWDKVRLEDLTTYRDAMLQTVSPKTDKEYEPATIRRRLSTILGFYRWAISTGQIHEPDESLVRLLSSDASGLTTALSVMPSTKRLYPRPKKGMDDDVRALSPQEYQSVSKELGPLPSDGDVSLSRDRLAAETSVQTGLRIDEVCSLTVSQIRALRDDKEHPFKIQLLKVTKTKGNRARTLEVPNWLISELLTYINNERAAAETEGANRGILSKSDALFLNHPTARHNAGKPMTTDTLDDAFRRAVIAAGFTQPWTCVDPDTGEQYTLDLARYSFHCLRHTFAIWRYYAERQNGNPEPWKIIQALLGHADLKTTVDLYLRISVAYEAIVTNQMVGVFRSMRKAARYG